MALASWKESRAPRARQSTVAERTEKPASPTSSAKQARRSMTQHGRRTKPAVTQTLKSIQSAQLAGAGATEGSGAMKANGGVEQSRARLRSKVVRRMSMACPATLATHLCARMHLRVPRLEEQRPPFRVALASLKESRAPRARQSTAAERTEKSAPPTSSAKRMSMACPATLALHA